MKEPIGFVKNKEEQLEEINKMFVPYATRNCKWCYGRAYTGWVEKENRYEICLCVTNNITKEKLIADAELNGNNN